MKIHPLACIAPSAHLGRNVSIGPFCVVEEDVVLGDDCTLASHVVVKSGTIMGDGNTLCDAAIIGGMPQHVRTPERPGRVVIGSHNTIREHVTVHRALEPDGVTTVGDHNLFMVGSHIAHDCRVGSHCILTNHALLGGHVTVEDRAYVSGAVAVHQFCRIGTLAMVGGHARCVQDIPPYVTIDGLSGLVVGLNTVGIRRAGYKSSDLKQLKDAYRVIYRSRLSWADVLETLKAQFPEGPAARFHEFLAGTTRGIISERRLPPGATLKLRLPAEEDPGMRVKAG